MELFGSYRLLVFLGHFIAHVILVAIDNEIVGEPSIECLDDRIKVVATTRRPFAGRIYAKGRASEPACAQSGYAAYASATAEFTLPLGLCGMKSIRSVDPRGMYYGITLVISFHPLFLTKVDKAFHVKCFFEEAAKGVTAELGVSMIPTTEANAAHGIPGCVYSIHRATIHQLDSGYGAGPAIQYAKIGDKILHKWECMDAMFGIVIKNCYVTDGLGQRAEVIDDTGCPIDPILISGIRYAANLTQAYAESHVFKFADNPGVWFFCQIQMCMKMAPNQGNMCEGVSPPRCAHRQRDAPVTSLPIEQAISFVYEQSNLAPINVIFENDEAARMTVERLNATEPLGTIAPEHLQGPSQENAIGVEQNPFPARDAVPPLVRLQPGSPTTLKPAKNFSLLLRDVTNGSSFLPFADEEISGQLLIYEVDEEPPSLLQVSKSELDGSLLQAINGSGEFPVHVEPGVGTPKRDSGGGVVTGREAATVCIVSAQGLVMLLSLFGGITAFLLLITCALCLRLRGVRRNRESLPAHYEIRKPQCSQRPMVKSRHLH